MKLIFISGPSGSGKTTLSKEIILKNKNGLVLSTDNYYKTGIISKLLSKVIKGYFDRSISFNHKLFKKDFNFIFKNKISTFERSYDFKKKITKSFPKEKSKEFSNTLNNQNYFFIELKINKNECMKRVLERDAKERGKATTQAENVFSNSWNIYYEKAEDKMKINKNEFIITKDSKIDLIIKKIFN